MNRQTWTLLFVSFVLAAACGGDDPDETDSGTTDVPADTPADLGTDMQADVEPDADVVSDVELDVEPDADAYADADPLGDGYFIDGLSAPVQVHYDEWGVPHVDCQSDADCAAALGYVHASDRFAQMDIRRRVTTGRIHQLVGELAMDLDVSNRALYSTPDGRPAEQALLEFVTPATFALLESYANGVNAWLRDLDLERNGVGLQDEYNFPLVNLDSIPAWAPEDSLSTVLALINQLTNDADRELDLGEAYASVDAVTAADWYGPTPATDTTILDEFEFPKSNGPAQRLVSPQTHARLVANLPVIRDARARLAAADLLGDADPHSDRGSNNWAIAPSQTADGAALLSNDPHLGLSNPAVWYYAHMDATTNGSGTFHAAGQSFAGMPWIVIGHNETLAWGATNSFFDMSDVYLETLSEDGSGVILNGAVVPFTEVDYLMTPFDADPETRTLRFVPHHGPVLSIDEEAGTAISLMWTGNRVTTDGNFLTELMAATTVDQGRQAATNVTSIGQNWVMIDTEGSIGWFPYNQIPIRSWASMESPTFLPLPGDGSAEWEGTLSYELLPQAYNPESGWIATANNDMTGALMDGDPYNESSTPLQVYASVGYRAFRIHEVLEAGMGDHTPDTMLDTVGDVRSALGLHLVPVILGHVGDGALSFEGTRVFDALRGWNGECPTGLTGIDPDGEASADERVLASSAGCAAFHVVFGQLYNAVFGDEIEASGATRNPTRQSFIRLLLRPETLGNGEDYWDDVSTESAETAQDAVVASLNGAGTWLTETLGATESEWIWGRVHTLTLRADLFDSFGIPVFNNGPFANDGGLYTVDVANSRDLGGHDYSHTAGASTRFVCQAPATGVRCTVQLPGGQRHYRDSDNYDDLYRRYLQNEPIDLLFDIGEASATAVRTVTFIATE